MDKIYVFVGGHARQNNGDAGIGITFHFDPAAEAFYEDIEYAGVETQNSAVYRAIIKAMKKAREWNVKNLVIHTDNRLVKGQLDDNMSARAPNIIPLYDEVKQMSGCFMDCQIRYVPSKRNNYTRELARAAAMASPDMVTAQALEWDVQPGITGLILAFSPKLMVVQFKYNKGSKIKTHKHYHEQSSYMLKGTLRYIVADREVITSKGAALVVTSNIPHSLEALEDSIEIVNYYPMRADLLKLG